MSISTARKISIAARIAAQHASRSRTFSAVMRAGRATGGVFGRILHQLWLEVTGFVFLVLASIGGLALVREYQKYGGGKDWPGTGRYRYLFLPDLRVLWVEFLLESPK